MIYLRYAPHHQPMYMTESSAGCDIKARESVIVPAGKVAKVPTGIWIERVDWQACQKGVIPELQVRARSGLAFKHGITLANGVGTIDADFPDEICVLLLNTSSQDFTVTEGMRVGQLVQAFTHRINQVPIGGKRTGGFGSTQV